MLFAPESKTHPHLPYLSLQTCLSLWSLLGFHAIADLFSLAKRVKYSDKQREDAQKLFNEHKAAMNLPDRELAQSLLE
jgi:hypothetical protein